MADFFSEKIRIIHDGLANIQDASFPLDPDVQFPNDANCLNDFSPLSEEEVRKIIIQSATKSCCLDPVPTQLVKDCLDVLLPIITRIINKSFETCTVPKSFKVAAVTPILKKANLIAEILKNFRPISNLPFLSKVLEKAASKQLLHHKDTKNLREKNQSAYRKYHSTETALVRIQHDLLQALDKKHCVFMIMLDLSAAFDTVNHRKLLDRLYTSYGIRGSVHEWISSYLTGRRQFVTIKGERSQEHIKTCDVPQGSILGPNFYEDYTAGPLGHIFRKHGVQFHIYADDTQAYVSFAEDDEAAALIRLEACLSEVRQWMAANWLKLNDTKTEFIAFGSQGRLKTLKTDCVTIGEEHVTLTDSVKSIGAVLDSTMKGEKQISAICKSAWFHLFQISKVKQYLTEKQLQVVVHAYVTGRLDQNNSLLVGLPKTSLRRLQMVQNASARMIRGIRKRDHITPILMQLHWLPIQQRILFKVLLLVYKSVNGKGPDYLKELLVPYIPSRSLRSGSHLLLQEPDYHYVETRKRAFGYIGPREWNLLPIHIRSCDSIDCFKRALKTYLFDIAYC